MKLNLQNRGREFFFITLVTEGRINVLSKINEDASVTLFEAGEKVAETWRETHKRNAALTASNFIIMPDHCHLLLIVNYDLDPNFDLIDWVHGFMERTAPMRRGVLSPYLSGPTGVLSPYLSGPTGVLSPYLSVPTSACGGMPAVGLGNVATGGLGGSPPSHWSWSRNYWLVLSFDSRQLKSIRRYIKLNPARYLWKHKHADMFIRHSSIKCHLTEAMNTGAFPAPLVLDGIGDLTILGSPFLFHVRLTLKKTVEEHREAIDEIIEKARAGWVPVSGFISPGEKEALRRLKAEPSARFIKLLPYALPQRYDPSAEDSRELADHRLVILSGFPNTPAISSLEMRKNQAAAHEFRRNCLAMNDLAAAMCAAAQAVQ